MNHGLFEQYPAIDDLQHQAKKRIPHFAWEYLDSGTGVEDCVRRNRDAFSQVLFTPQLMQGEFEPDIRTELFGVNYASPFGIGPVGLAGLIWPGAEKMLAATAATKRIPYSLSTVATESPESIGPLCGDMGWFQLYPPRKKELCQDLLQRARDCGFTTLMVTADVPTASRRERQIRAGVSVPPRRTLRSLYHCAIRPRWSLATGLYGQPRFRGLEQYLDARDMQKMVSYIGEQFGATLDWAYLENLRKEWEGPIVVKGLLDTAQARKAVEIGLDGIVVSNHGGRQFDAAPAALSVLPAIKSAVGDQIKLLFDSGVRSGLDIMRALALGADFVLLGRPFLYGVAAVGEQGADHVADILTQDLINNMRQLGCRKVDELSGRLATRITIG